jgi:hypothetical protein
VHPPPLAASFGSDEMPGGERRGEIKVVKVAREGER